MNQAAGIQDSGDDKSMELNEDTINENSFKIELQKIEPQLNDQDTDLSEKLKILHLNLQKQNMDDRFYFYHISYLRRILGSNNEEVVEFVQESGMMNTLKHYFTVRLKSNFSDQLHRLLKIMSILMNSLSSQMDSLLATT